MHTEGGVAPKNLRPSTAMAARPSFGHRLRVAFHNEEKFSNVAPKLTILTTVSEPLVCQQSPLSSHSLPLLIVCAFRLHTVTDNINNAISPSPSVSLQSRWRQWLLPAGPTFQQCLACIFFFLFFFLFFFCRFTLDPQSSRSPGLMGLSLFTSRPGGSLLPRPLSLRMSL